MALDCQLDSNGERQKRERTKLISCREHWEVARVRQTQSTGPDSWLVRKLAVFLVIGLFGVTYAVVMAHARAFMSPQEIGRGVTFMNFVFMGGAGVMQWLSGRLVNTLGRHGYDAPVTFGWLFVFMGVVLAAALAVYMISPAEPKAAPPAAR